MRFYPTMLEPGEITFAGWAYEPGWEITADPNVIPVTTTYSEENPPTVLVHIQPPQGELLGSGRPIDILAWTDTGEIVGTQRILDLPPVQFSPEQPPFAHGDLVVVHYEVGRRSLYAVCNKCTPVSPRWNSVVASSFMASILSGCILGRDRDPAGRN
jgi:hypothetical protein